MTRNARPVERQYSPERVAAMCDVSMDTVRGWMKSGELSPVYKLGHRLVRIPASAVNKFLEARRVIT